MKKYEIKNILVFIFIVIFSLTTSILYCSKIYYCYSYLMIGDEMIKEIIFFEPLIGLGENYWIGLVSILLNFVLVVLSSIYTFNKYTRSKLRVTLLIIVLLAAIFSILTFSLGTIHYPQYK